MFKADSSDDDDDLNFLTPEILAELKPDSPFVKIEESDVIHNDFISSIGMDLLKSLPPAAQSCHLQKYDLLSDGSSSSQDLPSTSRERTVHGISGAEFLVVPASSSGRALKRRLDLGEPDALRQIYTETIKEEIRCKIQLKRISEGREELTVDYTPPPPTISYEAVKQRNEVREKNKMYAKLSRERIRKEREKLENENIKLIAQRETLEEEVAKLKKVLKDVKTYAKEHQELCPLPEKSSFSSIDSSPSDSS